MPEEVLFEVEEDRRLEDVAATLRDVADRLESSEPVSLSGGGDSVSVDPPDAVEFEVKVEREGPADGPGELSLELELEWDEDAGGDAGGGGGGLRIE